MQNLSIDCRGISDISPSSSGWMEVGIDDADLDFISNISAQDIVRHFGDDEKLLKEIDTDTIKDYLESIGALDGKV